MWYGKEVVWLGRGEGGTGESPAPWLVRTKSGEELAAEAVVVAAPAPRAWPLLEDLDPALSEAVEGIGTAGLAVVALAFDAEEMGGTPDGFGFLVPRGTGPRILGCLWDSSIFPGRAPEGKVLLRAMVGGAHDPEAVGEPTEALVRRALNDLDTTMGLSASPLFSRVYRWPLGIGQYRVGHGGRVSRIERRLDALPGLWLAGSSYRGISINSCVEEAATQGEAVLSFLRGQAKS